MQTNTNLVIVPSRNRPQNIERAVSFLKAYSVQSDICVALDDDDHKQYPRLDGVIYEVNPRVRMNKTLNLVANKYADQYETIFFMGDDHLPQTPQWDHFLAGAIASRGYGLAYGNDLFQQDKLATAVMMSTNIIKSLGFMSPPNLIHLYMDNFWMLLGKDLDSLWYFDNVVIEHMHPLIGKAPNDDGYNEANSSDVYNFDREELYRFMQDEYPNRLARLKEDLGIK